MKFTIKAYSISEIGCRENQEDSVYPAPGQIKDSDRLFILCDGMGGHDSGEVASRTVCEAMSRSVLAGCPDPQGPFSDAIFRKALADALKALDAKDNGAEKKMGTTMTFLKLHDKGCTIAHIGDSRVYHIRPGKTVKETEILFQTEDHSLINDLIKVGELTPEEAKHSNCRNIITRAMQPSMEHPPKADLYHTDRIEPGDYFFLCSDGILEDWDEDNLKYTFSDKDGRDDEEKVEILVKATQAHRDNHSAIIIHILDVNREEDSPDVSNQPFMAEVEEDGEGKASYSVPLKGRSVNGAGFRRKSGIFGAAMPVVLSLALLGGCVYCCYHLVGPGRKAGTEKVVRENPASGVRGEDRQNGRTEKGVQENPASDARDEDRQDGRTEKGVQENPASDARDEDRQDGRTENAVQENPAPDCKGEDGRKNGTEEVGKEKAGAQAETGTEAERTGADASEGLERDEAMPAEGEAPGGE